MIDVVITTLPDTDRTFFARCLDSLANEPVGVHFVNGLKGCIGYGRAESLKAGFAPYVAFVDPDDEIVPGIFAKLEAELFDNPAMVYTDEHLIDAGGKFIRTGWSRDPSFADSFPLHHRELLTDWQNGGYLHHLCVFRRDIALQFAEQLRSLHVNAEGFLSQHMLLNGKVKHLKELGYKWRQHDNNTWTQWT